jgi:hypothetical protein
VPPSGGSGFVEMGPLFTRHHLHKSSSSFPLSVERQPLTSNMGGWHKGKGDSAGAPLGPFGTLLL